MTTDPGNIESRDGTNYQPTDVTQRRPNPANRWLCGYQHLGLHCPDGPTEDGRCCRTGMRASESPSACSPDVCLQGCRATAGNPRGDCPLSEPQANPGTPAVGSLVPCVPRKSAWFSRQTIALNAAILVGGVLLLCMALPQREAIFVPGGLSQRHSQILGNKFVSERCSLCHPKSHSGTLLNVTQDDLCLNCHDTHMPDAALRSPHDLTATQLTALSEVAEGKAWQPVAQRQSNTEHSTKEFAKTTCAVCHIEHHGMGRDIRAISDARCQACHQTRFSGFADGHPQFDQYPYRTERRIAFDHVAHRDKHFTTKNESFDCSGCHVDLSNTSRVGPVLRTVGFERACARCHTKPLQAATVDGWAVLQVPCISAEDGENPEFGLSDWPPEAMFDYDGEVSVVLRLLLASDPEMAAVISVLPESGKLSDIPLPQKPHVVRTIATGFRRLVADVAQHGQAAWQRRLTEVAEQAMGRAVNQYEVNLIHEMSAGLPPDLFREMEQNWFGDRSRLANGVTHSHFQLVSDAAQEELLSVDDEAERQPAGNLLDNEQGLLEDEELWSDDNDLLLEGDEGWEAASDEQEPRSKPQALTVLKGASHVTQGGWYLDQEILALRYMPRGHADKTLAAWAEFVTRIETGTNQPSAETTLWHTPGSLPGKLVPGGCTECHLVGQDTSARLEWTNWKTVHRPDNVRLFTKFDHRPHLTLPTVSDCRYCHQLEAGDSESLAQLRDRMAEHPTAGRPRFVDVRRAMGHFLHSEFVPMQRTQCVACHRPGGANDGCTQCHNYHVGNAGFEWSQSR